MSVCLLLVGDGRDDYRERAVESAELCLPRMDELVEIDDRDHRLGFAGAISVGWRQVLETGCDWVFHLELDFVFNQPIPVRDMVAVLEQNPGLAQMALMRQPVNSEEREAGGIVECHPDDFAEVGDGTHTWTEHRRYWTTNPSVYSTRWCKLGWPQEPQSEGMFTHKLLTDPLLRFGFWGPKHGPPMCEHIGYERAGVGY